MKHLFLLVLLFNSTAFFNSCCKPTPKKDKSISIQSSGNLKANSLKNDSIKIRFGGTEKESIPEAYAETIIIENGVERKATAEEEKQFLKRLK